MVIPLKQINDSLMIRAFPYSSAKRRRFKWGLFHFDGILKQDDITSGLHYQVLTFVTFPAFESAKVAFLCLRSKDRVIKIEYFKDNKKRFLKINDDKIFKIYGNSLVSVQHIAVLNHQQYHQ